MGVFHSHNVLSVGMFVINAIEKVREVAMKRTTIKEGDDNNNRVDI